MPSSPCNVLAIPDRLQHLYNVPLTSLPPLVGASSSPLLGFASSPSATSSSDSSPSINAILSLKDATRAATAVAKYCLVYLHAGDHEDTDHFVRNVLVRPAVTEMLSSIALTYMVDAYSSEGQRLEAQWSVTQLPCCTLLVKGRVVGAIEGRFTEEDFLEFLRDCDGVAHPVIHQEVAFVYDRNLREQLRVQHEREMAEAERLDREQLATMARESEQRRAAEAKQEQLATVARMVRAAQEEEERLAVAERLKKEESEAAAAEAAALALTTIKAVALSALPAEPPADADPNTIAKIRLVDLRGKQNNRSFNRSDPLTVLYAYARSLEGFTGKPFDLMCGFPPKPLLGEIEAFTTVIGDISALVPRSVVTMREQ